MVSIGLFILLTSNAWTAEVISSKDQVKLDEAKIEEIKKALTKIELDSQQSRIKSFAPNISEQLPDIISGIDEHLLNVDQEIGQFATRLQTIRALIDVANSKIEIEKKLRPATENSARYTALDIQQACEDQATVVSPSNIDMRQPIVKILDRALSKAENLLTVLKDHKSSMIFAQKNVDSGSDIYKELDKEIKRTKVEITKAENVQNLVEGFKKQVLTRYQKALDERFLGRTAEITQVKLQTQICFNQTLALSQVQESMRKPEQTSATPISAPAAALQAVSIAK